MKPMIPRMLHCSTLGALGYDSGFEMFAFKGRLLLYSISLFHNTGLKNAHETSVPIAILRQQRLKIFRDWHGFKGRHPRTTSIAVRNPHS